ncbi:GDP-6-deoxy-D-mannose reductase [subsurface metagenome]
MGSADEYGSIKNSDLPIKENCPLRPMNPYSISKVSADFLSYFYFRNYNLKIIRVRPFNHIGPRQSPDFVCSDFAKQRETNFISGCCWIVKQGIFKKMVRAYWLTMQKGEAGEVYNICSGKAVSIKEILDKLLSISKKNIKVKQDPKRLRSSDIPILLGDSTKFRKKTSWEQGIPFEKTLRCILDYWRGRF